MNSFTRWFGIASAALAVAGCSWLPFGPRTLHSCPGELLPTDGNDTGVVSRFRMRVTADGLDFPLEVVAQTRAGERVMIGFNPFGAKLFTVVQQGVDTRVQALPDAVLPVPPLNLVRDLHRVRLLSAPAPPPGTLTASASFGAVSIVETWSAGRLVRREFSSGAVIDFSPDGGARIDHAACGYATEVEMLSEESIP